MRLNRAAILLAMAAMAAPRSAGAQTSCVAVPIIDDRCETWTAVHGAVTSGEQVRGLASGGGRVFVTGLRQTSAGWDSLTVAYDAAGSELWSAVYDGGGDDYTWGAAAAPDGSRVYVTGESTPASGYDIVTLAYDGATGALLWEARYNYSHEDRGLGVTVSADGGSVYVLGGFGSAPAAGLGAIAYDAVTGELQWASQIAIASQPSPAGIVEADGRVIVAATAQSGAAFDVDFVVAAFRARDTADGSGKAGDRLWSTTYASGPGTEDRVNSLVASPDGERLYLVGDSGSGGSRPWATVALEAATGNRLWASSFGGSGSGYGGGSAEEVEVSPDGSTVYVAGRVATIGTSATIGQPGIAFAIVAYDTATGQSRWTATYDYPGRAEFAKEVSLSPDGAKVYVSGWSGFLYANLARDLVTVAYDTASGNRSWVARFNGSVQGLDGQEPFGMVSTPQGLFVAGSALRPGTTSLTGQYDFLTVAYPQ